jgi:Arc/MetJ family transcription regulator
VAVTTIRLDVQLVDEAARILGARSRSEAVDMALRKIVALRRFMKPMKSNAGKPKFDAYRNR